MTLWQGLHRPAAHGRPRIGQKPGQVVGGNFVPLDFLAARIVNLRRAGFADAIHRAQQIGFVKLRRGAAEFVPAAGVDDDQAAICIFQNIRRMKIQAIAGEKVLILRRKRGAGGREDMTNHFVEIEAGGEEIVAKFRAEDL